MSLASPSLQNETEPNPAWFEPYEHHFGGDDDDDNPFLWVVIRMLRHFVLTTHKVDFSVKSDFQHAIWILVHVGVSTSELAEFCGCTVNAVERWVTGKSSPTPVIRKLIINKGLKILEHDGLRMAGNVYDPITGELRVAPSTH